jgi:hypothetical protein
MKKFRAVKNITEFLDEAKRHGITALTANRSGTLYKHKLTRGLQPEPVYVVQNTIATADNRGNYVFRPHIIPVSRSFIDLPQCKASIDEFVGLVKAAREKLFRTEISTRENQNFSLMMEYPHVVRELDEYRRRLDLAIVEQAV